MISKQATSIPGGARVQAPSRFGGVRALVLFKTGFLFLSILGVIFLVRAWDLQSVLEPSWADAHLRASAQSTTERAVLLYIGLVAILSPLGVPRQALSAVGGYAFGALHGLCYASLGLVLGCATGFFYSRFMARSLLRRYFGARVQKLDTFLSRNPFAMTIALRFFPMGNNALLNLAAGLTSISALAFIAGSALGYLPQTIIFSLLGSGIRVQPVWRVVVSGLLFILASGLGYFLYRKYRGDDLAVNAAPQAASSPAESQKSAPWRDTV